VSARAGPPASPVLIGQLARQHERIAAIVGHALPTVDEERADPQWRYPHELGEDALSLVVRSVVDDHDLEQIGWEGLRLEGGDHPG